ncbi:MAG: bacteriocin [Acidaminococcaceae bacterium]|nr:bacteriocin [Acidaminococcaceae bacterium]
MFEKDSKKSEEKIPQPLNADKKIELTDEELEQVVGGMRQTGAALKELLNRSETIPSEIVDNLQSINQNASSEGYSRQKVNPAAVMSGSVL